MSLVKNSILNLGGYFIPSLIAIPALGILARGLGTEQFGIFTIALAVVGYASIFDAGLTRAVTREIALFRDNEVEKNRILATSTTVVLLLGVFAFLLIFYASPEIVIFLKVTKDIQPEVVLSLKILATSVPVFLINQIWLGVLEGEERFLNITIQKLISSSFIAGLPAVAIMVKPGIVNAILGLVIGRLISLLINFFFSKEIILAAGIKFEKKCFLRLLRFGGWITISNIISPLMSYLDRFFLSNLYGASVVAFYTAPSEAVSRLSIVPNALSRAIFPKLSQSIDHYSINAHKKLGYILLAISCLPIVLIGMIFADDIFRLWLGNAFAGASTTIFQVLLVGFMFNAFAQIPFSTIQARGAAKITALLHLLELIPYLIVLYVLIEKYSVLGAAIAWSARVVVDFIILYLIDYFMSSKGKYD
jgi:O-antigen/teichoic acid export membrane protein